MSKALSVSFVIVSRNRPKELRLLLSSLRYLDYPNFEVIVVGTDNPQSAFPEVYNVQKIKFVPYDAANISAARNLGITAAAGELVAFCDDDAVPEPSWLTHLTAGFSDPKIAAAGGFVRGRNGISFQWRGRKVDNFGRHSDVTITDWTPVILSGDAKSGIKTEGTNCIFRRTVLQKLGGFDENFKFFLDETDLNLRLGADGWQTAIVPLAQVHHGFAPSRLRQKNRAPRSLYELGASSAYFWKKHGQNGSWVDRKGEIETEHRKRLIRFMVDGLIEPAEIERLLTDLDRGFDAGLLRDTQSGIVTINPPEKPFVKFNSHIAKLNAKTFVGRPMNWRRAKQRARKSASEGRVTTVFAFSLTTAFHQVSFTKHGYWLHTGGIFGRSSRSGRLFRLTTLKKRAENEGLKLDGIRPLGEDTIVKSNSTR